MRVLFATYPEKTHFLAMAPLAWALRTAGHEVRFATQPKFCDVVTQAGLTAVPVGADRDLWRVMSAGLDWIQSGLGGIPIPYDAALWRPEEVTWDYLKQGYDLHVPRWHKVSNFPLLADLVAVAMHWKPDLVIWEPTTYAAPIAAKACGAAHARLMFGLDTFGVTRQHFLRLAEGRTGDPLGEWLASYAGKHGVEFGEDLITGQFTITQLPWPLRLDADLSYAPLRYTPYGGPAVVPKWLWAPPERPRVALTLGLSIVEHTGGFGVDVTGLLGALADLDVEIVATIPDAVRDRLPEIPGNTRVVPYVPLHALVPTCAAVIHHGGFGTLATTALNGVPQLLLPYDSDGPALARRVAAQGAGVAIDTTQANGSHVAHHLRRLLSEPGYLAAADRLRAEMVAMPSPNELAADLPKLADEHRAG